MAGKVLAELGEAAASRFSLKAWYIVHRYGILPVEDPIVFVATSADHRAQAFSACEFIMDVLKTDAPFWKRERFDDEVAWVRVKGSDEDRRLRWVDKDKAS
jgi:molybdopterin synthase catalytic subunit